MFLVTEAGVGDAEAEFQQGKNVADAAKEVLHHVASAAGLPYRV